ncbi:MAG: hypothetical protein AAFX93_08550 [Verrucomicrobiota bacterium]
MKKRRSLTTPVLILLTLCFVGCETWPMAAARAARKRTTETGPVMGELQEATGMQDPLGRKQVNVEDKADDLEQKADGVGERVEDVADSL